MKPMDAKEFERALKRLGFSNRGFCLWLGVEERTGRRWASGEISPVQPAVAAFLRLAIAQKLDAEKLRELLGD